MHIWKVQSGEFWPVHTAVSTHAVAHGRFLRPLSPSPRLSCTSRQPRICPLSWDWFAFPECYCKGKAVLCVSPASSLWHQTCGVPTASSLVTPARWLAVELSSDVYLVERAPIPQVKGLSHKIPPPPPKPPNFLCYLHFWPTGCCKSKVPMTPVWAWWCTELRKPVYPLDGWSGCHEGPSRIRMSSSKMRRRGWGLAGPEPLELLSPWVWGAPPFWHVDASGSPAEKLLSPILLGSLWRLRDRHDSLDHWQWVTKLGLQPLSFPQSSGGGTENSNLLITGLVPLATSPHP